MTIKLENLEAVSVDMVKFYTLQEGQKWELTNKTLRIMDFSQKKQKWEVIRTFRLSSIRLAQTKGWKRMLSPDFEA